MTAPIPLVLDVFYTPKVTRREAETMIGLGGHRSRGRTVVDRRDWSGDPAHDPHGDSAVSLWRTSLLEASG